jgi:hypothetical protein
MMILMMILSLRRLGAARSRPESAGGRTPRVPTRPAGSNGTRTRQRWQADCAGYGTRIMPEMARGLVTARIMKHLPTGPGGPTRTPKRYPRTIADSRADNRADNWADSRADNWADSRADNWADNRADSRANSRANSRADSRTDSRADGRAIQSGPYRAHCRQQVHDHASA